MVPRRVIATWWEATDGERADILALIDEVKRRLDAKLRPDGYNVGFNAGTAAGQTVGHLHVHVIPRYRGDMPDPRGGVRHVIPGKGNYLQPPTEPYVLVDGQVRLLRDDLLMCLRDPRFDRVDLLVSFVMKSGLELVHGGLVDALDRGAKVRVLTTDYLTVTDADALARLLDLAEVRPEAIATRIFHDPATSFHPKAYLFWSADGAVAATFVGSNNLSASGIAGGIEWAIGTDQAAPLRAAFEQLWSDQRSQPLTHDLLADYRRRWQPATHTAGVVPEPPATPPALRPVQQEALAALEQTRLQGFRRGLVVMATGLGKTWLAAFDTARPQFRRCCSSPIARRFCASPSMCSAALSQMRTSACTTAERSSRMPASCSPASRRSPGICTNFHLTGSTTWLSTSSITRPPAATGGRSTTFSRDFSSD